jgi:DNA-binding transcriptional ArsR family regulator
MSTLVQPDSAQMQLATVMAALSDPVRVTIVRALAAQGEFACGTLELGISPATRSHHFRVLREAGITNTRVSGTHRFISLRREELDERFPGLLDAVLTAAEREAAYTTPAS